MSKIAFIFPGQASQYVGMGQDLYEKYGIAKELYDKANNILGFDIKKVSFEGPLEDLKQTNITQPAIFIMSVILDRILKEKGFKPEMTAGHSLGEYSAHVCAETMSFENALEVVKLRGSEMQKAGESNPGTMAAIVGLKDENIVIEACKEASVVGVVQAANFNSPGQTVISGSIDGVRKGMEIAKEKGAKIVKELVVSGAFHSPLMESAVKPLTEKLDTVTFNNPKITVVPNVTAKMSTDKEEMKKLLIDQVMSPVKWTKSVEEMISNGIDTFIEVGPGNVLKGLGKRISRDVRFFGVQNVEDIENLEI
ncbi:MAG: ACP S-malonyltransferase [Candidatus Delongbacteria bacterium]|jgi:[acyl-carrier-protein] S-malonyltransferase|nr:ACP S-malonyltransferase [Candidatus Delongbacteria bacterium]